MLKGKAEIILTEVDTGKKEIIKEDNLVTNALNKLASINIIGNNPIKYLIPMKAALQGLFLIDENIEENPNNFILPYNCRVLAHAGSESNADDSRSGSFNTIESEDLDNGYKFVWDFATHQANGTIKCLSLTSQIGGKAGFGGSFEERALYKNYFNYALSNCGIITYEFGSYLCSFVDDNKMFRYITNGNIITFEIYDLPMNQVSLTSSPTSPKLIETYNVELEESTEYVSISITKSNFYILTTIKNSSTKVIQSKLYEVNKTDFTIVRKIGLDTWSSVVGYNSSDTWIGVVNNGFIYMFNSGSYGTNFNFYKVNLSNPNDIKEIENKWNSKPFYYPPLSFYNNRLYGTDCVIENDELNYMSWDTSGLTKRRCISSLYDDLVYATFSESSSISGKYKTLYLHYNPFYLATINNLSSPIVKTADKTMKVIYTITNS